ncbi:MAG: hypothetical protein V3U60_16145 [Gammaproteobacteria bacterium]
MGKERCGCVDTDGVAVCPQCDIPPDPDLFSDQEVAGLRADLENTIYVIREVRKASQCPDGRGLVEWVEKLRVDVEQWKRKCAAVNEVVEGLADIINPKWRE